MLKIPQNTLLSQASYQLILFFMVHPAPVESFFANALAGEIKKRNPHIRILKLPETMLNASDTQFTIELIREYAPCIVIVDEIDVIDGCHKFWIPYFLKVGREFANMPFYDRLIHQLTFFYTDIRVESLLKKLMLFIKSSRKKHTTTLNFFSIRH